MLPHPPAALAPLPVPVSARDFAAPPDRGARVLAADDNEINRALLACLLDHARPDLALTLVADGAAALAAWRAGAFDLVLLDVRMPGMDGRAAAAAIRAEEAAFSRPRTPILALSAETARKDVDACRAAGMDGHLAKPLDLRALLDAVDAALARRI